MNIMKKIKTVLYNIQHKTSICSTRANLLAEYGKEVIISENVVVTQDVEIGDYSYVNRNSSIENCIIGRYCSISSGVWICPYEHDLKNYSTHPMAQDNKKREKRTKVIIGNDVLISLNAIILSGVKIGDGAVIAAGAVVTKNVLPYEIVGGVPAKHIGWRFDEEVRKYFSENKWWEKDITEVKKMEGNLRKRIENEE